MSETIAFSPFGTVAQRFRGAASPSELEPWLHRLQDTLPRHDLSLETGYLAWEMTQWQPGLSSEEQAALFTLLVVSLVNLRQGSTRFPVEGEAGEAYLRDLLVSLFGTDAIDIDVLIHTIQNLLSEQKAPMMIGGPADYKPLLFVPPPMCINKSSGTTKRDLPSGLPPCLAVRRQPSIPSVSRRC